ncbi:Ger(x)C family spore germination protein [Cohnella sp.]|uniref:Ger(x)C family spore germination protein n=1 Tax=Cohnella sp. TaxID=1883426 RepID=UPI00356775A7
MIRVRKVGKYLALISCIGLFTGCWDRVETDDLAMVLGSGLDLAEDGQIEGTIQIALPTGIPSALQSGGGAKKPVLTITEKGKDGVDILQKMQHRLSRRVFLGHRGIIVIGESYARHGIDQVLDNYLRMPDTRYHSYVVTSYGSSAKEILNVKYELEQIPSIGINKIQISESGLSIKIDEFLDAMAAEGKSPMTGAIRILNKGTDQEIFSLDKVAVYKENKLVGFLSEGEKKASRLMTDRYTKMRITTQMVPKDKQFKGTMSIEILRSKVKIRTAMREGSPEVSVSLKLATRLLENDTNLDITKSKNLKHVQKKFTNEIQHIVESAISKSQKKFKADIFGFGRDFHIQHPYTWKKIKEDWKDLYPSVHVTVKADLMIERMERTQAPPHLKKAVIK